MKWFSLTGIRSEISRIRWPKGKDLLQSGGKVLLFTVAFALFFVLCDFISMGFLKFVGM